MRNRGVILFLAIILILVCAWELHFTFATRHIENKAIEYAAGDSERESTYLDSIKNEEVWLGIYTYKAVKAKEINFGLDLQGGMNLTLEISVEDLLKSIASTNAKDSTFVAALDLTNKKQKNSAQDYLILFQEAFEEIDPDAQLSAIFTTIEMRDKIERGMTNDEVITVIKSELKDAIDNAENVLRTRIDQFGVVQPNIQRLETQGRFVVDLPGLKDPERVKKVLQTTAQLEFWHTYENNNVFQSYLLDADRVLSDLLAEADSVAMEVDITEKEELSVGTETEGEVREEDETEAADDFNPEAGLEAGETNPGQENQTEKTDTEEADELMNEFAIDEDSDKKQSAQDDEFSQFLDQMESTDTTLTDSIKADDPSQQYPLISLLRQYPSRGSAFGVALERDIKKINEYLAMAEIRKVFPRDVKFFWDAYPIKGEDGKETNFFRLHAIKDYDNDEKPQLTGDAIVEARESYGQQNARPQVNMSMNAEGAQIWARMTRNAAGNENDPNDDKCIAIVLDNRVYSSPKVSEEIPGGSSRITGDFNMEEARDLANVLKSGKLPARAEIIQEAVVGPSLGKEAINAGFTAFLIAFVLILIYMFLYYGGRAGSVADFALIINMFFIIGVLASLKAVLTLPGIAGIVLTIGMSVDANVLIYERIKEEIFAGKGLKLAIADGYKNAYSAIIDANLTTLLTGVILYIFGVGPIRGFATTLIIGILTSLFSAIFITRLLYSTMLTKNTKISFSTSITKNAFKNLKIKFLDKRKIAYAVSGIVIAAGIISLVVKGLNPGVDFKGGRQFLVRFDQDVVTADIAQMLTDDLEETPEVITHGGQNQIRITTAYKINDNTAEADEEIETLLYESMKSEFKGVSQEDFKENHLMSSEKVGPSIAFNIKRKAIFAIFFSLIIIFFYIMMRFRNWQFGLGALVALVHDVLLVLGVFSIFYGILPFSMEINQAFIAAILTVVGYSINDTVVVFDRIREYIGLHKKSDRKDIFNKALNSTVSRTFSTSLSTFVVLLTIFLFGGENIQGFTFALLIGVVVGTYSSLFIATPVVFDSIKKTGQDRVIKGKKSK